jgi:hypothetical protein
MTTLARPAAIVNDRPIFSSERIKDYNRSVQLKKKILVVVLKRIGAKKN